MQASVSILNDAGLSQQYTSNPYACLTGLGIVQPDEQQFINNLLIPASQLRQMQVASQKAQSDYVTKLNVLKKLLDSEDDQKTFTANPDQYLAMNGIINAQDQSYIKHLLTPAVAYQKQYLKMMMQQHEEINAVNRSYRDGLSKANHQTIQGFHSTMIMYNVSFYLGIALIITAVVFAITSKSSLFSILFGSIGILDLLTFFIVKPPESLQKSRSEQAKLNAAFYSWFIDLYNWNSFYVQYSQKGQVVPFDVVKDVSDAQVANTEKLMKIISEHINMPS